MCGKQTELFKTNLDGAIMDLCSGCANFGKVIHRIEKPKSVIRRKKQEPKPGAPEKILVIVDDYSKKVRKARERLKLKQEEFAKRIAEKESVIHKLETGQFEPSIKLARKLEKLLGIVLIEEHKEAPVKREKTESEDFTVADLVKIKKR